MFVIDPAEPGLALVEVGLESRRAAIFHSLRAKLDSRIGVATAADPEFDREVEIADSPLPEQKLVRFERLAVRNLASNRTVDNSPVRRVAAPSPEGSSIEQRLARVVRGRCKHRQDRQNGRQKK